MALKYFAFISDTQPVSSCVAIFFMGNATVSSGVWRPWSLVGVSGVAGWGCNGWRRLRGLQRECFNDKRHLSVMRVFTSSDGDLLAGKKRKKKEKKRPFRLVSAAAFLNGADQVSCHFRPQREGRWLPCRCLHVPHSVTEHLT